MDCSLPGSAIHGIFQARELEWGAIAFSEDRGKGADTPHSFTVSLISKPNWKLDYKRPLDVTKVSCSRYTAE